MDALAMALAVVGMGTLLLGVVHVVLPRLIVIETAIPAGPPLRPLPLVGERYRTRRADVLGVVWVSNNAASYVLITLGLADLAAAAWTGTEMGRLLALWATGWWAVRSMRQLAFGRRSGDLLLVAGFGALALLHIAAAA